MSRLGKLPIKLVKGSTAVLNNGILTVKGPKGELTQAINGLANVEITAEEIKVSVNDSISKKQRAMWGLFYSLINNMVIGVTEGYEKKLEIQGVGYKVANGSRALTFSLGFSHTINFPLPDGIEANAEGNIITVKGIDKQMVGEITAQMRRLKKPEPYKGKGIRYVGEIVRRKAGKTAAKGA
ncbi:MAG: 50S ribosomal protein L6 [Candidatus Falkowbacteria bacterium]|nr:50S ribosomal protein L6 [Candidatus Falkowbacteria bacterium]